MLEIGEQKRLSFRIEVEWPVILETAEGSMEGKTRDISAGGAHIRCIEPVRLNEPAHMTITPPGREPLKVAARVIWSDSNEEANRPRIIGVKFTEITTEDRKYIEQVALERFKSKLPES